MDNVFQDIDSLSNANDYVVEFANRKLSLPVWMRYLSSENRFSLSGIPRFNSSLKLSVTPMLPPYPPEVMKMPVNEFMGYVNKIPEAVQQQEIIRCMLNPGYLLDTYCWIRHKMRGIIRFNLYDYQRFKLLPTMINQRLMITRKFRQGGFSTAASGFGIWMLLFERDKDILIISKSDREALLVMSMAVDMWERLPLWLKDGYDKPPSKHTIHFPHTGTKITALTPRAGRSYSLSLLILDEAAFIADMETIWGDIYPTVSTGGQVFVISTVNGIGNWYHEYYENAVARSNDFVTVDVRYTEHPDYSADRNWALQMERQLGEKKFRQEILAEFLSSMETYMPFHYVKELIEQTEKTPPMRQDPLPLASGSIEGALWIWEEPRPDREYVLGSDIGAGMGDKSDASTIEVFDIVTLRQVAEFSSNKVQTGDFAKIVHALGNYYNTALAVIERNQIGVGVIDKLLNDLNYENLYFESANKPGLTVTKQNRLVMIDYLVTLIRDRKIEIMSRRLASEWSTFIYNPKLRRPQHLPKFHDDLIFAAANVLWVCQEMTRYGPVTQASEEQKVLFEYTPVEARSLENAIKGRAPDQIEDEPLMPVLGDDDPYPSDTQRTGDGGDYSSRDLSYDDDDFYTRQFGHPWP